MHPLGNKINVIATSGSGKTTFAKQLADKLNYPHIEMDVLYWNDNWVESSDIDFLSKLELALKTDNWVLDGNYSRTQSIKWKEIDTIIWLDYPLYLILWRVITRSIARSIDQKNMWNTNNKESFQRSFMSQNSIILWVLSTYTLMKKRYEKLYQENPLNCNLIRIKSPREAKRFLSNIKAMNLGLTN